MDRLLVAFGRMLADARDEASLSHADVAAASGLTPADIAQMEAGEVDPDLAALLSVTDAVGLHLPSVLRQLQREENNSEEGET
ncbi:helix-turn-helix transcriptional regulator [Haloechinothrix salitolerans]|uniref:Helix-turn-helix domain-containing protein n=1 Tax=Haloechinothrix salitolerans TaxID=926830 RepID=A0ABW2BTK4_9PSEU